MKRRLRTILCALLFMATSMVSHAQQDSALVALINAVRANPASFLPSLEQYRTTARPIARNKKEFDKAFAEIDARLRQQAPLPPYHVDEGLMKAAWDHCTDCERHGLVGHFGSDKSDPGMRMHRYTTYTTMGESCTYGHATPAMILAAFLVDEGTPGRGHRENMLSTTYTQIGLHVCGHPRYGTSVVIDHAR